MSVSATSPPRTGRLGRLGGLRPPGRVTWSGVLWWVPALYALIISITRLPPDSEPLLPDAQGYFARAIDWYPGAWLGGFREPAWGLANAVPIQIFGEDPTVLRMSSVVMFVALIVATQYLAREAVGTWLAIAVGAVLALSEWLILQAVSGLREETAALAAVVVCVLAIRLRHDWRYLLMLGVLAGLAAMVRWDTVILTLPVLAGVFWQHRVPRKHAALALVGFAVVIAPFLIGNAIKFDDPTYHSNVHSKFFRNLEFAGQPGYPTKEEVAVDAFAGPDETWPSYLFEDHDLGWVVEHSFEGTINTALAAWTLTVVGPAQPAPQLALPTTSVLATEATRVPWLLFLATIIGLVVLITRRTWPIALMLVLALVQHAPIQHIMDMRLGLASVPFMAIAVAAAVRLIWTRAVGAVSAAGTRAPA